MFDVTYVLDGQTITQDHDNALDHFEFLDWLNDVGAEVISAGPITPVAGNGYR